MRHPAAERRLDRQWGVLGDIVPVPEEPLLILVKQEQPLGMGAMRGDREIVASFRHHQVQKSPSGHLNTDPLDGPA